MKSHALLISLLAATQAGAETSRQLDAHEHGVGTLNIAVDGQTMAMEFHAPGADIVGFEHPAETEADLAKVERALAVLSSPLDLFVLPPDAGCTVVSTQALLAGGEAAEEHDDHDDHDDHDEASGHTEFHATYTLTCTDLPKLTDITFAYFENFENAREVEVQVITGSGAASFHVEKDAPSLNLRSLF